MWFLYKSIWHPGDGYISYDNVYKYKDHLWFGLELPGIRGMQAQTSLPHTPIMYTFLIIIDHIITFFYYHLLTFICLIDWRRWFILILYLISIIYVNNFGFEEEESFDLLNIYIIYSLNSFLANFDLPNLFFIFNILENTLLFHLS